jgi:outer membrane protein TolC
MRARPFGDAITTAIIALAAVLAQLAAALPAAAQGPYRIIYPEQRSIDYRDPSQFPYVPLPPSAPPPTVTHPPDGDVRYLSLDDAIRICLENDRVVRVLSGVTATASGRTIYDPAIVNTTIDEQQARFDPLLVVNQSWDRFEPPSAVFVDPNNPAAGSIITGVRTDQYALDVGVTKDNPLGGQWDFGLSVVNQRFQPGVFPLNPQTTSVMSLGYTQPLLKGSGMPANLAPIVLARIDTERSFFQLKSALQDQMQSVIEGYWNLVAARANVDALRQQVEQAEFGLTQATKRKDVGLDNGSNQTQALTSLSSFRADLIAADNAVLQREAALRNVMGLPPWDEVRLVPTTPPRREPFQPDWQELVELAAARRPDLIELKLILEADEQQIILANNAALPQLDAVGLYRWNGLSGEMPNGNGISSGHGEFTDWTLGVNFSVPLGLRQARATLRQRELILARDRANLDQGLHAASHDLATTVRSLELAYNQYQAFLAAKAAAERNYVIQKEIWESGFDRTVTYLNVLVAITDQANSARSAAAAAAQFNTLLGELERQTGTILETHGVRFYEERFGSIGPLGRLAKPVSYPQSTPPTLNADRYPAGDVPAERVFDIQRPIPRSGRQGVPMPPQPQPEEIQRPPPLELRQP